MGAPCIWGYVPGRSIKGGHQDTSLSSHASQTCSNRGLSRVLPIGKCKGQAFGGRAARPGCPGLSPPGCTMHLTLAGHSSTLLHLGLFPLMPATPDDASCAVQALCRPGSLMKHGAVMPPEMGELPACTLCRFKPCPFGPTSGPLRCPWLSALSQDLSGSSGTASIMQAARADAENGLNAQAAKAVAAGGAKGPVAGAGSRR